MLCNNPQHMTIKTEQLITLENELKRIQYELKLTNRYRFYEKHDLENVLRNRFNIKGKQSLKKSDMVTFLIKEKMKSYDDVESEA